MDTGVFQRTEAEGPIISDRLYNLVIGLVLSWGFLVNYYMVKTIPTASIQSIGMIPFLIGYFASCFAGIYLFKSSTKPWVSFLGYNLVVVPFGLVINVVVSQYDGAIVLQAVQLTGMVTFVMMVLGTLFPAFFRRIIGALTIALLAVIVIELVMVFVFKTHHALIDMAVVLIFCGYIGYDWGRANQIPKTVDNAVDSAAALYIDIINLFLRILRLLGRRK